MLGGVCPAQKMWDDRCRRDMGIGDKDVLATTNECLKSAALRPCMFVRREQEQAKGGVGSSKCADQVVVARNPVNPGSQ